MGGPDPYFKSNRRHDGTEILPTGRLIHGKLVSAGSLLIFLVVPAGMYFYLGEQAAGGLLVSLAAVLPFWALTAIGNLRMRSRGRIPLIVGDDRAITYGARVLFAGGEARHGGRGGPIGARPGIPTASAVMEA